MTVIDVPLAELVDTPSEILCEAYTEGLTCHNLADWMATAIIECSCRPGPLYCCDSCRLVVREWTYINCKFCGADGQGFTNWERIR
jgi:hypothetical protein